MLRLDHLELQHADARSVEARRLRARRQHENSRDRPRRVHRARQSSGGIPARHLRPAADVARVGALRGAGTLRDARHRRRRVHEHQHEAEMGVQGYYDGDAIEELIGTPSGAGVVGYASPDKSKA